MAGARSIPLFASINGNDDANAWAALRDRMGALPLSHIRNRRTLLLSSELELEYEVEELYGVIEGHEPTIMRVRKQISES